MKYVVVKYFGLDTNICAINYINVKYTSRREKNFSFRPGLY